MCSGGVVEALLVQVHLQILQVHPQVLLNRSTFRSSQDGFSSLTSSSCNEMVRMLEAQPQS